MHFRKPRAQLMFVSCSALFASGCGGNVSYTSSVKVTTAPDPAPSVTLTISGASSPITVGQTLQLRAIETTGSAAPGDVTATAVWQISKTGSLAVSPVGLLTCNAAGIAQITAGKDGASASVSITCNTPTPTPPPLSLTITGASNVTTVGQTLQLHASETIGAAVPVDVTTAAVWQVSTTGAMSVSISGMVTCNAAGTAQVIASKDGVSSSVVITCTVPASIMITLASNQAVVGGNLQLHASETTGTGAPVDVTTLAAWQVSSALFRVTTGGLATCIAPGTAQVTATKDNASNSVLLTCTAALSASLPTMIVSGLSTIVGLGGTSKLSVSISSGSNPPNDVTGSVTWNAVPGGFVSVNASGLLTCVNIGSTVVSATKNNVSASLMVTCEVGSSTLSLTKQSLSLRVGSPEAVMALGATPGSQGVDVTSSVTWATGSLIATVSSGGVVSCIQDGVTTLTAVLTTLTQTIPLTCSPSSWNTPTYFMEQSDEFVGPFASWIDVKDAFGAVGDGITDDTAAVQAALDTIADASQSVTLWFPPGTYAVNNLQVTKGSSFSLIGADPRTTTLRYIGPAGGTMLQIAGSDHFRVTRLSFDGSGTAGKAEDLTSSPNGAYTTYNELSDQHIYNVNSGIALSVAAETTIERVFFDNLPGFGVQTGGFNTLNIFINDCLFVKNGTGVTNTGVDNNAGSFIVSNSFFSHSTVADMSMGNTSYETSRHNTSVGSAAAFIAGKIGANPAAITIQNNIVLDPSGIPFQLGNMGPLMLIDNVIRTQNPALPVIMGIEDNTVSKSVFSFGNIYTTDVAPVSGSNLAFQGVVTAYDDSVTDPSSIPDVTIPANVYVPPNKNRPIFEVPANSPGEEIQRQINLAVSTGGDFPVVHMPPGHYHLTVPLIVPFGSHIDLVGDDCFATVLLWDGTGSGPALELDGTAVTIRGVRVAHGTGTTVDGIQMLVADQPSSHIVVDQAMLQYNNAVSVNFDGLDHANAELFSTYVLGTSTGVNVVGGPFRYAKTGALGITNFYTGSAQSAANSTSFDVTHGGRLLVQDNWHDGGATGARNFILSGSGKLTEQSGAVYVKSEWPYEIDDFDGDVSLIGIMAPGGFVIKPGKSITNLLTLGLDGATSDFLPQPSSTLVVANLLDEYYGSKAGVQIPSSPAPDLKWLRTMFAVTRSEYPVPRMTMALGGSRAQFARISVDGFISALHFVPNARFNKLVYTLVAGGNVLGTDTKGIGACSGNPQTILSNLSTWNLRDAGDGDYNIVDANGVNALGLSGVGSSPALAPISNSYDQRWIIQDVGDGRKIIKNRLATGVLTWNIGACPKLMQDASSELAKWTFIAN